MTNKKKFDTLCIDGTSYKTQLTKKFMDRKNWEKPNEKMVLAFIPGTINEILVKEGQKVKAGTKLLILEAMKMKNVVAAPISGKIKLINVEIGNMVPKRKLLIEIE